MFRTGSLFIVIVLFFSLSCVQSVLRQAPSTVPSPLPAPNFTDHRSFWFAGAVGRQRLSLEGLCPQNGVEVVRVGRNLEDHLFLFFSFGIYTPLTYEVWCRRSQGAKG